jgi:hypothetical protein
MCSIVLKWPWYVPRQWPGASPSESWTRSLSCSSSLFFVKSSISLEDSVSVTVLPVLAPFRTSCGSGTR